MFEGSHHVRGILPRSVGIQVGSHVLDLQLQILPCSVLGALEVEVLQKVSHAAGLLGLVATAALDEDGDAGWRRQYLAILDCMSSEATVMPLLVLERSA